MGTVVLDKEACAQISALLEKALADTYVLYIKTQNCHWNVVDERFHSLHEFFEEQYKELAEAVDIIAERIRMLGRFTPASMSAFLELTSLSEIEGRLSGKQMLQTLLADHEALSAHLRGAVEMCDSQQDAGTSDMLVQRLRAHEKAAWMLRSHLS